MKVSFYKNIADTTSKEVVSVAAFLKACKNGKYKKAIQVLREAKTKNNQRDLKKQLPNITASGIFSKRSDSGLITHSGLIQIDIDQGDNENLEPVKICEQLTKDKYTFAAFISPTGTGVKVLVKILPGSAKTIYSHLQTYYSSFYSLKIDTSCSNVSRAMFVSYDPELYHHQDSEIFTIPQDAGKPPQKSPSIHPIFNDKAKEVELLIEKIEASRADITGDYEQWLKIGFALASEFNVKGESYYHQISRFSPSYNPDTCKAQFKECCKNRKNGIAINTLFAIAKEHNIYVHEPAKNKTGKTKDVSSTKTATPGTNTKKRDNVFIEAENFINEHYDLRFNEVSNRIEERKKGSDIWKDLNENNIYRFLMHNNYALSMNKLTALLRSDFVEQFNPFEQYFKSLASYDNLKEPDYIKNLCGYVYAKEPERFEAQFKKHLVRCVACSIDNSYYNKQAFVIVHDKQNSGKSTFCRWLCPPELDRYFGENINLTNKDGEIALSEKFLINMDELAALSKYEINQLKSVFSRDKISLRRPFDRSTSDSPRRCSFFGSTNRNEFLFDETGSVRWLCFEIELIDWDYKKDIDINRVWAQAYSLFKTPGYKYDLDYNEIAENEAANERFFVNTPEEDLLKKMYSPGTEKNQDAFLTATDIQQKMQEACNNVLKLNSVVLGRILHKNRFVKVSKRYPNQQTIKGYHVLFN